MARFYRGRIVAVKKRGGASNGEWWGRTKEIAVEGDGNRLAGCNA